MSDGRVQVPALHLGRSRLRDGLEGRRSPSGLRAIGEDLWNGCFTFAFVRNPWDRLVSCWQFTRQRGKHDLTFADFVKDLPSLDTAQEPDALERAIPTHWHAMPQSDHLVVDGVVAVDFVGHVETLDEDWHAISARIGYEGRYPARTPATGASTARTTPTICGRSSTTASASTRPPSATRSEHPHDSAQSAVRIAVEWENQA
jgi:hypothetical protein